MAEGWLRSGASFSGHGSVIFLGAAVLVLCWFPPSARAKQPSPRTPLVVDDFENGLSRRWSEKVFSGHTEYRVVHDDGNGVLRAESRGAASGLVYRVNFDPMETPILSWRWKVENTLERGDGRSRGGDDYAARVYVVFPHWFPLKTRALNYVWANRMPPGTMVPNPFMARAMMFAVRSGPALAGEWVEERRDLVADFRRAFDTDPPPGAAIAVMTDTDQTGESAVAYYDDFQLAPRTGP